MSKKNKPRGKPSEEVAAFELEQKTFPKKSLGQNFLTSEGAIFKIIQAAKIVAGETVLEIGPGRGVLTSALLEAGAKVVAVEKDHELFENLKTTFDSEIQSERLTLVEGDALKFDMDGEYKVVANIPYNITGQFLRKSLESKNQPKSMVILLQKEVVERIVAADKKESLLSISIKVYGEPKKIATVKAGSFYPAPNVDSAVIAIENISKDFFKKIKENSEVQNQNDIEEKFFEILRAGFAHKRKMLAPNLAQTIDKEKVLAALLKAGISEKARAEDLTLEQWQKMAEVLFI